MSNYISNDNDASQSLIPSTVHGKRKVLLGVTGYKSCLDTTTLVRLLSEIAEIKIIVNPQANSMLSSAGLALDVLGDEEEWYRWRQVRHATRTCNSDTIPLIKNNPYFNFKDDALLS